MLSCDIQIADYMIDMNDNCDYLDSDKSFQVEPTDLTILHSYIRGLNSKIFELSQLIDNCASNTIPDAITLCETWLTPLSPKACIPGYILVSKSRISKKGGGVGILINSKHMYRRQDDLESTFQHAECCVTELRMKHGPIAVCSLYRPPNTNTTKFVEEFEEFANRMKKEKLDWIAGMDHNMDLLKSNIHKNTQAFIESILECNMLPTITWPTRICKTAATLIDNILISQKHLGMYDSGVLIDNASDHLPCITIIKCYNAPKNHDIYIESRDIRKKNIDRLKENLDKTNWSDIMQKVSHHPNNKKVEGMFNAFYSELTRQINNFCPIAKRKVKSCELRKEAWVTGGILKSIRKSKQLYKLTIRNQSSSNDKEKYQNYMKVLNKTKCVAKKMYYIKSCNKFKSNTRKLWQIINKISGNEWDKSNVIDCIKIQNVKNYIPKLIANEFSRHYASVGKNYASKIPSPQRNIESFLCKIRANNKSIFLEPTNQIEITKLIKQLPNKKSSGHYKINNIMLKEISDQICEPLAVIFNESMQIGVFPSKMKLGEITPLYKSKSKDEVENYRPISLLITISKVLEKIIYR